MKPKLIGTWDELQEKVIRHSRGRLIVVAGPGTGKTQVIIQRIIHLIEAEGVDPASILALTFSRRAAREMREKVALGLSRSFPDIKISTFPSFCLDFVKHNFRVLGYRVAPELLTSTEQWRLVRSVVNSVDPDHYPHTRNFFAKDGFIQELFDFVLRSQENLLLPEDLARKISPYNQPQLSEMIALYRRYLSQLKEDNLIDFGGLSFQTVKLLSQDEEIKGKYQQMYSHIVVDEFQETNYAQLRLVEMLYGGIGSLMLVGDDDQSIYGFRGARVANLLECHVGAHYTEKIELRTNYRNDPQIATASQKLIAHNRLRIKKQSTATKASGESAIETHQYHTDAEEASSIAQQILRMKSEDDLSFRDFAILMRSIERGGEIIQSSLLRAGIPCQILGDKSSLYNHPLISGIISFLKVLLTAPGQEGFDLLLKKVLLSELFSLDPFLLREMERAASLSQHSLFEYIHNLEIQEDPSIRESQALKEFRSSYQIFRAKVGEPIDAVVYAIWKSFPLFRELARGGRETRKEAETRIAFLRAFKEFYSSTIKFSQRYPREGVNFYLESLEMGSGFVEDIDLPEPDERIDAVNLLTIHQSKGWEFRVVFMPMMVEGSLPTPLRIPQTYDQQLLQMESKVLEEDVERKHLDEERRLAYVAMTRARDRLILSYADSYGASEESRPSRFLAEMGMASPGYTQLESYVGSSKNAEVACRSICNGGLIRLGQGDWSVADQVLISAYVLTGLADPDRWWVNLPPTSNPNHPHPEGVLSSSYSSVQTYKSCPMRYKFDTHFSLSDPRGPYIARGNLYHRIMEEFFRRGDCPYSVEGLRSLIDQLWDETIFDFKPMAIEQKRDAYQKFSSIFAYLPPRKPRLLALEKKFRFALEGHVFRGRIDQIDELDGGRVELIDYKSTSTPLSEEKAAEDLQLGIYLLATSLSEDLGDYRDRVASMSYFFITDKGRPRREQNPSPQRETEVREEILDIVAKILAEEFPAQPESTWECNNCEYQYLCPRKYGPRNNW